LVGCGVGVYDYGMRGWDWVWWVVNVFILVILVGLLFVVVGWVWLCVGLYGMIVVVGYCLCFLVFCVFVIMIGDVILLWLDDVVLVVCL